MRENHIMRNLRTAAIAAAIVSSFAAAQHSFAGLVIESGSNTYSLSTLIPSGGNIPTIQVGDLLFYNFGYSATGQMPSLSYVNLTIGSNMVIDGTPDSGTAIM